MIAAADFSFKRRLFYNLCSCIIKLFGLNRPGKAQSFLLGYINPLKIVPTKYGPIFFSCPNELIWWRVDTYFEKEPEIIDWIDKMAADAVFFDIGANIGLYSFYAAKKGNAVYSFEPEALNYSELCKNAFLNKLQNMQPVNLALSSNEKFIILNTSTGMAGTALLESELTSSVITAGKQTTFCTSVDQLLAKYSFPVPTHIKIDVDGPELEVIKGMSKTLLDKKVVSVFIEIDEKHPTAAEIVSRVLDAGFKVESKTDFPLKINNYIFTRN